MSILPAILLSLAAVFPSEDLILTKGETPAGGRYEIEVRTKQDGTQIEHGEARYYAKSGKLVLEGRHAKGKRSGKWSAWRSDGSPLWKGRYKAGIRCKEWTYFDGGGPSLKHLTGTWQLVDRQECNGAIRVLGYEVNGVPQGQWRIDWWNGSVFSFGAHSHGLRSGAWRSKHPDGAWAKVLSTGGFRSGKWTSELDLELVLQEPLVWDLPPPKAHKWDPTPTAQRAHELTVFLDENGGALRDAPNLSKEKRKKLYQTFLGFFGGHGFGWSWEDNKAGLQARNEALESARTLSILFAKDALFWGWVGSETKPPIDNTQASPYFLGLSPFSKVRRKQLPKARAFYAARSPKSKRPSSSSRKEREAVDSSLAWLASVQQPDGFWTYIDTKVENKAGFDVGLTSLALLAFLGSDSQPFDGPHADTIVRGLKALQSAQEENGRFSHGKYYCYAYENFAATLVFAEAYGLTGHPGLRGPMERAATFTALARNPYGGWRYTAPSDGETDTSVTVWAIQALVAADAAGFAINREGAIGASEWLQSVTDRTTGRIGYVGPEPGGRSARQEDANMEFSPEHGEAMTAAGFALKHLLVLIVKNPSAHHELFHEELLDLHQTLIAKTPLSWKDRQQDSYYAYFGCLAASLAIGPKRQFAVIKKWREHAAGQILQYQSLDGANTGSWDPTDAWGSVGGRVYTTAMYTLALENRWRLTPASEED